MSRRLTGFGAILAAMGPATAMAAAAAPATVASPAASASPAPVTTCPDGKRVIALYPVRDVQIRLPDGTTRDFGTDLTARLTTRLTQSGCYIVIDPPIGGVAPNPNGGASTAGANDYHWASSAVPAADLRISIDAFSFTTGVKGERMFHGFDERSRTPFNDGFDAETEEFPLRAGQDNPSWFDHAFDAKGDHPFDSRSGLDATDGFNIDLKYLSAGLKRDQFASRVHLRLRVTSRLTGRDEWRDVDVTGSGFYFDVYGGYAGYSGKISIARRAAMLDAMAQAMDGAGAAVERAVAGYALTARVDAIDMMGQVFLGTGAGANVAPGTVYAVIGLPGAGVVVKNSYFDGSIADFVAASGPFLATDLRPGMLLRQVASVKALGTPPMASAAAAVNASIAGSVTDPTVIRAGDTTITIDPTKLVPAVVEKIILPSLGISEPDLSQSLEGSGGLKQTLADLLDVVTLPYRLWRFNQYDQAFARKDGDPDAAALIADMANPSRPIVAVIDTGVDYNHSRIHGSVWINPTPTTDGQGRQDRYGWDFVGGDSRPYDDAYHGTQVASAVLKANPAARIMALKAFNPWGVTTSAALYASFRYAVDHGARVIVCGWATRRLGSQSIEGGVAYARDHGVAVVAAAGDEGDDLANVPALPASLAAAGYANVLAVTGVDASDRLLQTSTHLVSYGPSRIALAVPAAAVDVAEPREGHDVVTSTSVAAGLAAGALSAQVAAQPLATATVWISALLARTVAVDSLRGTVQGGRVLR